MSTITEAAEKSATLDSIINNPGFRKAVVESLVHNDDITWMVDANAIISGEASKLLLGRARLATTPEIISEVRKRSWLKPANHLASLIEFEGGVIGQDLFNHVAEGFNLLVSCAVTQNPIIQYGKRWYIEQGETNEDRAEELAIQKAAIDGDFFKPTAFNKAAELGLIELPKAELDARSRRSWSQFPAKKRKLSPADYKYSDEILIATALALSMLRQHRILVFSNDADCSAIMKQLTDNLCWKMVARQLGCSSDSLNSEVLIANWEAFCQELNQYREEIVTRQLSMNENVTKEISIADLFCPPNGLSICRYGDWVLSTYTYPEKMASFVQGYQAN